MYLSGLLKQKCCTKHLYSLQYPKISAAADNETRNRMITCIHFYPASVFHWRRWS